MSEDELVYRRRFRAPRELVWRCLTEPTELARYWGPQGVATPLEGIVVELYVRGQPEAQAGFGSSLDKLDEHLARQNEKGRP